MPNTNVLMYLTQGTVDSGHYCCRGYNEVVMLRRLPERHKHNALHLLHRTPSSSSSYLYEKPHDVVRYLCFVWSCNILYKPIHFVP